MEMVVEAGAKRISLGGSLTWAAVDTMASVARAIIGAGDFSGLRRSPPLAEWFS